jgi:hypothetical protein
MIKYQFSSRFQPLCARLAMLCGLSSLAGPALATDLDTRMLAQEGLSIALSNTIVQSQILMADAVSAFTQGTGGCTAIGGAGSVLVSSVTPVSATTADAALSVFYDAACKSPALQANIVFTMTGSGVSVTETAASIGLQGQALGSLSLTGSATSGGDGLVVIGTGQFTPAGGGAVASLGVTCTVPGSGDITCQSGVAQPLASLRRSTASITPLTIKMGANGTREVHFMSAATVRETGTLGALSITQASGSTLGISGKGQPYPSTTAKGRLGDAVLFPKAPSHWVITDATKGETFLLHALDQKSDVWGGRVLDSATGARLAVVVLDKSGTGAITYAGRMSYPVTNWLISD